MRRFTSFVITLLVLVVTVNNVESLLENYRNTLENEEIEEQLNLLGPKSLLKNHRLLSAEEQNKSSLYYCARDLAVVEQAIIRKEIWALTMLDASSKIPSGLLKGNIIDIGMYDECIAVHGKSLNIDIQAHHCMYSISTVQAIPLSPTLSICIPTTCTADDIIELFNATIYELDKIKNLGVSISNVTCAPIDQKIWTTEFTVCFTILLVFVSFLIVCTLCEIYNDKLDAGVTRNPVINTLGQFSLRKSAAAILSTEVKEDTLPVIHGIRFLSICWIVLGHEYVLFTFGVNVNVVDIVDWANSWQSLYIFVAPFAVDTFFALSGFLMTYIFLKQIPKQKSFNVPMYLIHRYLRLTPSVIALIVFAIVFVPIMGSGARWDMLTTTFGGSCRTKWWPMLLYLQNFIDRDNLCLGHLWYIAVDMQLFLISPLILYPLYRWPKIGLGMLSSLLAVSLIVPATIVGINKYPAASFMHDLNITLITHIFQDVYIMPYNRAAPWLIGILLGFEVVNHNRRLSKVTMILGWLLTAGAFAFCTFGTRSFMDPNYVYNETWETFFVTTSRPIWAIGVCWIIYASINNRGGLISKILSSKIFFPLSRLSYCIYLVHIVIQLMVFSAERTPSYFSNFNVWHLYLSDLSLSIVTAFFFSLMFESPIVILEKLLFKRHKDSRSQSQKNLITNDEESVADEN